VYKCTLCSDRVGQGLEPACIKPCPTGCLKFGTKTDMRALADARAKQLREHSGFPNAGVYDPASIGGTHVIYVLHDITKPELYGGAAGQPADSRHLHAVEARGEADRAADGALRGAGRVFPLCDAGPKDLQPPNQQP
jgi:formate dehydrogenase iron-sulfur subunit